MLFLVEGSRRKVAKAGLLANAVIEERGVFGDFVPSLFAAEQAPVMLQFSYQSRLETSCRRVFPAVFFATHRCLHAELLKQFLVSLSVVLPAVIRVVKRAFPGALVSDGPE